MQWHRYPPLPRPDREPARNAPSSSREESSETDSDNGSVYEPFSTGSDESQIRMISKYGWNNKNYMIYIFENFILQLLFFCLNIDKYCILIIL